MGKVVLVKHAKPIITPAVPSPHWELSSEGIKQAENLSRKLDKYSIDTIFSSEEPKAIQTAKTVSKQLNCPIAIKKNLHEHERLKNQKIYPEKEWKRLIDAFFTRPDELIFGEETAVQARERFDRAMKSLLADRTAQQDKVIVTHGTVISLFVEKYNSVKGFELWNKLGLPSYVELDAKTFRLLETVNLD
ncbi:histidine phosphatase family protein [Virgibacillus senegalensis]|uniref:histidine phosphatase family protein n=1 Tax=Virgibacillus senegalensis TaxID=1499679 RepID=UPI00069E526E|nr:histidine phosphatase family protein [Virgibacillus senegalensis]